MSDASPKQKAKASPELVTAVHLLLGLAHEHSKLTRQVNGDFRSAGGLEQEIKEFLGTLAL